MRIEPFFDSAHARRRKRETGRALSPLAGRRLPRIPLSGYPAMDDHRAPPLLSEIAANYDVRSITPREMVDLSFDLYVSGFLDRDQYSELAFQSELMPNFSDTIGALTGERADPDRPRDFTAIWEARLAFETEHCTDNPRVIKRTAKILDLLLSLRPQPRHPKK